MKPLESEIIIALRELVELFEAWKRGPLNGIIKWIEEPPAIVKAKELLVKYKHFALSQN